MNNECAVSKPHHTRRPVTCYIPYALNKKSQHVVPVYKQQGHHAVCYTYIARLVFRNNVVRDLNREVPHVISILTTIISSVRFFKKSYSV